MTIKYKTFNQTFIEDRHGKLYFYRDLYEGNHVNIFDRAKKLVEEGELINNIMREAKDVPFTQTPYIVANISKLIVEVPAILVARSIGKIDTSLKPEGDQDKIAAVVTDDEIEGPDQENANGQVLNLQQELIRQIVLNSKLDGEHWSNIVQYQLDGGLVGVPWDGDRGLRVEFKARDVYFPHEDELGADLSYARDFDEIQYLHIYRERLYKKGEKPKPQKTDQPGQDYIDNFTAPDDGLRATHTLIQLGKGGVVLDDPVPPDKTAEFLNMEIEDLDRFYVGRKRLFIRYLAHEKTFMNPLGVSVLKNQEGKQDEINWTLTRSSAIFERNGKPRIAINKELAASLQKEMIRLYGEAGRGKFDSRKLEVVQMNDQGKSMEIIQIDISKIGDVQWVKDLIKMMLMETKTSEKAIDFYMSADGGSAVSGIAKFYDLFISLMKAEFIRGEYIPFLKGLIEDVLWLANLQDPNVRIEQPEIGITNMIPIQRSEVITENMQLFTAPSKAISLETLLRKIYPDASEDWIQDEMARIEAASVPDDTTTLTTGRAELDKYMDVNDPKDKKPDDKPKA